MKTSTDYAVRHVGEPIHKTKVVLTKEMQKYDYWFLFSPTCQHCIDAFPTINCLIQDKKRVLGITITNGGKEEELLRLKTELMIDFPVSTINKGEFFKLTRKVPRLFEIKNDKIINVHNGSMIKEL